MTASHFGLRSMTLLVFLCSLNQAASEIYYITTNSSDHRCILQSCLNLSQFAANSSHYLHSGNTTLVFLLGIHYLTKVNLTLSNVENIVMKSESSIIQIECTSYSHMQLSDAQCIYIANLEFVGCGGNEIINV